MECGAAPLVSVSPVPGSSAGYWATPQPHTTAATPSTDSGRRACERPVTRDISTASPQAADTMTSARPRCVSPWNSAGFEPWSSTSVASASAPETAPATAARTAKYRRSRSSEQRPASRVRYTAAR